MALQGKRGPTRRNRSARRWRKPSPGSTVPSRSDLHQDKVLKVLLGVRSGKPRKALRTTIDGLLALQRRLVRRRHRGVGIADQRREPLREVPRGEEQRIGDDEDVLGLDVVQLVVEEKLGARPAQEHLRLPACETLFDRWMVVARIENGDRHSMGDVNGCSTAGWTCRRGRPASRSPTRGSGSRDSRRTRRRGTRAR